MNSDKREETDRDGRGGNRGVQLKNQQEKTGAPSPPQSSLLFLPVFAPSRL